MDIELRHLRAFAAVATSRSFSRAAEQLFITQPALTRTVRQLETLVGADLIDRATHPVSLTPAGRKFLPYATRILSHLDAGVAEVRGHATVRGEIAVARDVRVVRLFDETRVAACSVNDDLAGAGELDWHDAPGWTLVVNTISGTTGPWSWPEGTGPRRVVPTANFDEWLESVAAGRGIGIVPDVARRRSIHPAIRFIPLRNAPLSPVSLAFRHGVREPLLRRFVDAALSAVGHPTST